jgi:hypothetical protein
LIEHKFNSNAANFKRRPPSFSSKPKSLYHGTMMPYRSVQSINEPSLPFSILSKKKVICISFSRTDILKNITQKKKRPFKTQVPVPTFCGHPYMGPSTWDLHF